MRKRLISVLAVLSLLAVMTLGVAAVASAEEWPPVKPMIVATTDGSTATFVIMVQNDSTGRLTSIDVRGALHGNRLLKTWAGNPESHRAKNYGDTIGWINLATIAAGKAQGPFVFQVDLSGQGAVSHAWLRFISTSINGDASTGLVSP